MIQTSAMAMVFTVLLLFSLSSASYATVDKIQQEVQELFPNTPIMGVTATPVDGMYEIVMGGNIMYVFPGQGYLMFGELWSVDGENITGKRMEEIAKKGFENLPLDLAIRLGSGDRRVIKFTDPDCPFCVQAYSYLDGLPKGAVTQYIFLHSFRQHPKKLLYILCSDDPARAYNDVFSGRTTNIRIPEACDVSAKSDLLAKHLQAASMVGVLGVPVIYINGQRVDGFDVKRLDAIFETR